MTQRRISCFKYEICSFKEHSLTVNSWLTYPYINICGQKELRMKPKPQRYIDLNHSGSNGAKAPPQSPNGYPGTEAPSWSLPGSGAEAFFGANPAPLPRADLAHLGAETALGLICLLLEQRIFSEAFWLHLGRILLLESPWLYWSPLEWSPWKGDSFGAPSLALLERKLVFRAPLDPFGAGTPSGAPLVSSELLWLHLGRRLQRSPSSSLRSGDSH